MLSIEQIDRLFSAPARTDPCWRRDRALLELLYATGCRASELSNLRLRDMHLDESFCICRGKGDKERLVPLNVRAVAAARAYLKHERPRLAARVAPDGRLGAVVLPRSAAAARADLGIAEALRRARWGRRRKSVRIPYGTVLPPICWPAAPIFARCKRCSATRASPPRRSIRTSIRRG